MGIFDGGILSYGLVMAAAALAGLGLMLLTRKKHGLQPGTVLLFWFLALPLCVLAGRAFFWLCSLGWITDSGMSFWDFAGTGYSYMLYGAVLGGVLAAFLASAILRQPFARIADAAAAPAALAIAAGRFAEYLVDAGHGTGVLEWFDPWETWSMIPWEDPSPVCRFPFAVQNYYGTWRFSINLWEGIAAVVFLVVLLRMKKRRSGGAAVLLMLMYAACQITFESMRRDEVVIWGFVKASQLLSALVVLGVLLLSWFRLPAEKQSAGVLSVLFPSWVRLPAEKRRAGVLAFRLGMLLLSAGVILLMEFALDQKINFLLWMRADLSYIVMAACCVWMLLNVLSLWRRAYPPQPEGGKDPIR